jgi:hypothetical protein
LLIILALQVNDKINYACGNGGNESMVRITIRMMSRNFVTNSGGATLAMSLGGTTYLSSAIPSGPGTGAATITAQNGSVVSPNQTTANDVFTTTFIDIPCSRVATNVTNAIVFRYFGQDDFVLQRVSLPACIIETCGGQGITCPGLQATKACTPGPCYTLDAPVV